MTIPYSRVTDVTIADRNVSTFEVIVGGLNSRQLNVLLRLERLTSIVVPAQAKRCAELEDLLRVHQIPSSSRQDHDQFKSC